MREENKQSNALANKIDIEAEIVRDKVANLLSWFFSNLFSLLFPVGAVFLVESFEKSGNFDFKTNYSEMLMVTISICMNLIIQLNSKDYKTKQTSNTLIRVITVGMIVISSLAYGISKTIPEGELENNLKMPTILTLCKLAEALEVDISELYKYISKQVR